jgi:GR25 family glycosyltransferase involved in LPS biosynthesis
MQAIPVFVISLARAADRRSQIMRHLAKVGVEATLVDAIDGAAMSEAERAALVAPGQSFHPGVVGCYMSHITIYRRMVEQSIPLALILEDDALLNPAFVPALRDGIEWTDFDYCFLDCDSINPDGPVYYDATSATPIARGFTAYRTHGGPATLHAYLITLGCARRRLDCALPIIAPIDVYAHLPWRPRFFALLRPKGAFVAEASLRSFTSSRDHRGLVRLRALRRSPLFYRARDLISLELWRRRLRVPQLVRDGVLPAQGAWRPLPTGRLVMT